MGEYAVDTSALGQTKDAVWRVHRTVVNGARKPRRVSEAAMGTEEMADTVNGFHDHWNDKADELEKQLEQMAKFLEAAIAAYDKTDTGVAAALTPGSSSKSDRSSK